MPKVLPSLSPSLPSLPFSSFLSHHPLLPAPKSLRQLEQLVDQLEQTDIASWTLRFVNLGGGYNPTMEDKFYRDDALRYKRILEFLFTWVLQFGLFLLTVFDLSVFIPSSPGPCDPSDGECTLAEFTDARKREYTVWTLALRMLVWLPLVVFGCTFFGEKSDSYFKNRSHLAGAFVVFGFYLLSVSLVWGERR